MSVKTYSRILEKRIQRRIPVQFNMQVDLEDRKTGLFYHTCLVNYSSGGVCVEWGLCRNCPGYSAGAIHPDCIFSLYDADRYDSNELTLYIYLSGAEETVHVKGKAVYTFKHNGTEQIGIAFTEVPGTLISRLDDMLDERGCIIRKYP